MVDPGRCNRCGAELAAEAGPEGLCPGCLLKLALPDSRTANEAATETRIPPHASADRIGPYRILQKLGEGGMGEVYEAEQEEPIRRKVALKLIKAGMDTKQVVARFESERQALALMNHPNIARVHDAGATAEGRPYFVMEYVPGVPITEHCDRHRLGTEDRLEMFQQVCEGVQHAHQKGIIHRDLKPSNVLVQLQDDKPVSKIIDFGVAKATAQRLTEKTLFTQLGVLVGTPAYMSPEQAEMTGFDVDTRTDVYSLGVLLYELLVGALPFDPHELREAGFDEIRRVIREEEPSKPSTRLSTSGGARSSESAKRRQTDPASLVRELRGDLDWITMKALEKERGRRYGSPSDLAADIQRHLIHEPVVAGPPSTFYRAKKFMRRHRIAVSFVGVVALLLTGFAVAMAIQAGRIARARDQANQQAATAEQVSEFLVNLFEVSDPGEARGNTITAREVLDKGAEEIRNELADRPEVRGRLLETMGRVYRNLGLHRSAEPLLEEAVESYRKQLGEDHPLTLEAREALAWLHVKRGDYSEAEDVYRDVLEARRRTLAPSHPDALATMNKLGNVYRILGRYDEAEPLLRSALTGQRRLLEKDSSETLATALNLATLLVRQGHFDEAKPVLLEVLEGKQATLGEDHPDTLTTMEQLAQLLVKQGRYADAEDYRREAVEGRRQILGEEHPDTLISMGDLANLYRIRGNLTEAEKLFRHVLAIQRRVLDEGDRDLAVSLVNLAMVYTAEGRHAEAEPLLLDALGILRRSVGEKHPDTLIVMRCLAEAHAGRGRFEQAESILEKVLSNQSRLLGEEHPDTLATLDKLGRLYGRQGRQEEAVDTLSRVVELRRRKLGAEHPHTLESQAALAALAAGKSNANPVPQAERSRVP